MSDASFDLWLEPWIRVQNGSGEAAVIGLREALYEAWRWRDLADPSPLVAAAEQRLLVAILQDALRPETDADLVALWKEPRLPVEPLDVFETHYADRFDLFSPDRPFLQSADLGLVPSKTDIVKSVFTLHPDWPAGGESTHFRHGQEDSEPLCPACAAAGLVLQSAFAAAAGRGIGPSINGAPPLYVLPQKDTLAESLVASLVTPDRYPIPADRGTDDAWWRHDPIVGRRRFVPSVGYVHSLTFPARQARLHPAQAGGRACVRCGARGAWVVWTMVCNMGETRVGATTFWQDPFLAYKVPRDAKKGPLPLRPQSGRALWRDYGSLFLDTGRGAESASSRPKVLAQIDAVVGAIDAEAERASALADPAEKSAGDALHVRCVGMRTDQAKVFEWVDEGLQVPLALLHSRDAAIEIELGLGFAERIRLDLLVAWGKHIETRRMRYRAERTRMLDDYWARLAAPFDRFTLDCATAALREECSARDCGLAAARCDWTKATTRIAEDVFAEATSALGDDGVTLKSRVQGEAHCRGLVTKHGKEHSPDAYR